MGPVCSRRAKAVAPVPHEPDLFGYDLAKAESAALARLAIELEVDVTLALMGVKRQAHALRVRLLGWAA
jgi:hypothetical protein